MESICFPKIIINKDIYKILCKNIKDDKDRLFDVFKKNDLTPPSNLDDTLFDGSLTRRMPYLMLYKPNEVPIY